MNYGYVELHRGKEKALHLKHHWIFSGAVSKADAEDGSIVKVVSGKNETLGYGYYNSRSQIRVRMLTFGETPFTTDHLRKLIRSSIIRRKDSPFLSTTNARRLVFSEGDFLPGLIVDDYNSYIVLQSLTLGIDFLKNDIVEILTDELSPKSIYERSDHAGRAIEGAPNACGELFSTTPSAIEIEEHNVRYIVDVKKGQKTGFFLDQRENRQLIQSLALNKKILNLFSYNGGFTFAAIAGGARETISVDISESALAQAREIETLNGFTTHSEYIAADVFSWLRNAEIDSDIIIVDPPAFAKSRGDVDRACRGYKDINLQCFLRAPKGSLLLTCSCSRFIDPALFQKVIFGALADSGRSAQILRRTGHPFDHPINAAVPETEYLKALLLIIE